MTTRRFLLPVAALAVCLLAGWCLFRPVPRDAFPSLVSTPLPAPSSGKVSPPGSSPVHSADVVAGPDLASRTALEARPGTPSPWTVAYGQEFWRQPASAPADGLNLASVMDRVRHAWSEAEGVPAVTGAGYQAELDGEGLVFRPGSKPAGADLAPDGIEAVARFQTLGMRGAGQDRAAGAPVGGWQITGNTAQRRWRGDFEWVEHYQAGGAGVAVTWVLPSRPAGPGGITVAVGVQGVEHAGRTTNGLHFADATGAARVRVGEAWAVASDGARWALAMNWNNGQLDLEVPAGVLETAAYPLAIDPMISAEFGMDAPVLDVVSAPWAQTEPAVAFNGTDYLVVWADQRNSDTSNQDIFGARVTTNGVVLDPDGLALGLEVMDQAYPAVAACGQDFLVVWEDPYMATIHGMRVSGAGVVLDFPPIMMVAADYEQIRPSVAANGSQYLVVWQDNRNNDYGGGHDIFGTRVTIEGTVLDADGILLSTAANDQVSPVVASAAGGFLVAWEDRAQTNQHRVMSTLVSSNGVVAVTNGVQVAAALSSSHQQRQPALGSDGARYFLAWREDLVEADSLRGLWLEADGTAGTAVEVAASIPGPAAVPTAAAASGMAMVAWRQQSPTNAGVYALYGRRVAGNGTLPDSGLIPLSLAQTDPDAPALVTAGGRFCLAWHGTAGLEQDVFLTQWDSQDAPVSAPPVVRVSAAALLNQQYNPAVAFNGTRYLAVWRDTRGQTIRVYGTRITTNGAIEDPNGLLVSGVGTYCNNPVVASNGKEFLAVWEQQGNEIDLYGARVNDAGQIVGGESFAIAQGRASEHTPAVASNGKDYLVAWVAYSQDLNIYGARVSGAGVVLDDRGFGLCEAAGNQSNPDIAAAGGNYLVVWQDARNQNSTGHDIYGCRVTPQGARLDPAGLAISTAALDQLTPAVGGNSGGFLVAWEDERLGADWDVFGSRLSLAGAVLDRQGLALCRTNGNQSAPAIGSLGRDFLVVWQDDRHGEADLWGGRVPAAGGVPDPNGFLLSAWEGYQTVPAVAVSRSGPLLVLDETFTNNQSRVIGRFVNGFLQMGAANLTVAEKGPALTLQVLRLGSSNGVVTVPYATSDESAQAGLDYTQTQGTLTFTNRQGVATITVPILGDTLDEANETFRVALGPPAGGAYLGSQAAARVTILDDDVAGALGFKASALTVSETNRQVTITVVRTGGAASGVSVDVALTGVTATESLDYVGDRFTVQFNAGQASRDVVLPIVNDGLPEPNETVRLTLENPRGGAVLGPSRQALLTLLDDEVGLQFATNSLVVMENASLARITVVRTGPATRATSVGYATASGTAAAGVDYQPVQGVLRFGPGVTSQTFTVPVLNDSLIEPDKTVLLLLTNATDWALLGTPDTATLILADDDTPVYALALATNQAAEARATVPVTVLRSNGKAGGTSVTLYTSDGTAAAGQDYMPVLTNLAFAANEMSKTVLIPVLQDPIVDANERFHVTLYNPAGGARVGSLSNGVVVIADDDQGGLISLGAPAYTVSETNAMAVLKVQRTGGLASGVTVFYTAYDRTARDREDYEAHYGTVVFGAGVTAQTIAFPILNDTAAEGDETFRVEISSPFGGAKLGPVSNAVVTIKDDEYNVQGLYKLTGSLLGTCTGKTPVPLVADLLLHRQEGAWFIGDAVFLVTRTNGAPTTWSLQGGVDKAGKLTNVIYNTDAGETGRIAGTIVGGKLQGTVSGTNGTCRVTGTLSGGLYLPPTNGLAPTFLGGSSVMFTYATPAGWADVTRQLNLRLDVPDFDLYDGDSPDPLQAGRYNYNKTAPGTATLWLSDPAVGNTMFTLTFAAGGTGKFTARHPDGKSASGTFTWSNW